MGTMRKQKSRRKLPARIPAARAAKPEPSYPPDDGPFTPEQTREIQEAADRLAPMPVGPPRSIKWLF